MGTKTVLGSFAMLCMAAPAQAYFATATVTFDFGGNGGGTGIPSLSPMVAAPDPAADVTWSANGANALASVANSTYFTALGGYNLRGYYNADFATRDGCAALVAAQPGALTNGVGTRKYGCRFMTTSYGLAAVMTPVTTAAGDSGPGARAAGTITVTDTLLSGTLTIQATTDEPTGATTTFTAGGSRISTSVGNGASGYNYRTFDGSPFGNAWWGVSTAGTLQLALTGVFTAGQWQINGGTARFTDPGFACGQSGYGASPIDSQAGTLCTPVPNSQSTTPVAGAYQHNGAQLSWGWDVDGAASGTAGISPIQVRDAATDALISTLAGVLASVSVSPEGVITTHSGEFRRGLGSAGNNCTAGLRYDGASITCGTLIAGRLAISGVATETVVPLPATAALFAVALGLAGRRVRVRPPGRG